MPRLVQPLFDGPIDLVGDVHGEIGALNALMGRLGYDQAGRHPERRRIVFVGDLVDRGENSPAVLQLVRQLVAAGSAQAVLGNHELNLLLAKRKEGNGWFYADDHDQTAGHFLDAARSDDCQREETRTFLETLPLVLEREDLRVVHACWWSDAVDLLRGETGNLVDSFQRHSKRVDTTLHQAGLMAERESERARWQSSLHDRTAAVPFLPATATVESARQSANPLKAVTSGLERPTAAPFFASGKWRMTERVAWWNEYDEAPAVVMGHYWRWPGDESAAAARSRGPNLFEGTQSMDWLGPRSNVMCIDWCAGLRWRERAENVTDFSGRLGALRWPEREIVFDH